MPPPEKPLVPQEEPPDESAPPISDPPEDPKTNPKAIDVDDAQIEPPRDTVFRKTEANNTTNRLKERDKLAKELSPAP
jgi:hypothetical protein